MLKGIAWDLYNEPHGVLIAGFIPDFSEAFLPWAKEMKAHLRKLGDNHLVTVGIDDPERLETVLDFTRSIGTIGMREKSNAIQKNRRCSKKCGWIVPRRRKDAEQRKDMRQALLDTFGLDLPAFLPGGGRTKFGFGRTMRLI